MARGGGQDHVALGSYRFRDRFRVICCWGRAHPRGCFRRLYFARAGVVSSVTAAVCFVVFAKVLAATKPIIRVFWSFAYSVRHSWCTAPVCVLARYWVFRAAAIRLEGLPSFFMWRVRCCCRHRRRRLAFFHFCLLKQSAVTFAVFLCLCIDAAITAFVSGAKLYVRTQVSRLQGVCRVPQFVLAPCFHILRAPAAFCFYAQGERGYSLIVSGGRLYYLNRVLPPCLLLGLLLLHFFQPLKGRAYVTWSFFCSGVVTTAMILLYGVYDRMYTQVFFSMNVSF